LEAWNKGLPDLFGAFELVLRKHPDARLQLVGAGDPTWAYERAGSDVEHRLAPSVDQIAPSSEGLAERYGSATVTVLPSFGEAFGIVLIESLACGTPIVAGDDCGPPEIVSNPAIGRLAEYGNPQALDRAIQDVIELASEPGTAATCREHARTWSWADSIGPQHETMYRASLDTSERRRAL
jgi:glycosyltransferase involved in cell wall biosynthesis